MQVPCVKPIPPIQSEGDIGVNIRRFRRHLRAENLSPNTETAHVGAAEQFARYLAAHGMPQAVAAIRREHVEAFIADLLEHWKPSTANNLRRQARASLCYGHERRDPRLHFAHRALEGA